MPPKLLSEAIDELLKMLKSFKEPESHCCFSKVISNASDDIFYAVRSVRVYFKSRDRDFTMFGFGAADLLKGDHALANFCEKRSTIFADQFYFMAERFDKEAKISHEWQDFGQAVLILPLVSILRKDGITKLILNYRADGLAFGAWLDHAQSILHAIKKPKNEVSAIEHEPALHLPDKEQYVAKLKKALSALDDHRQKVVMGRRTCLPLKNPEDPAWLFFCLKANNAFLFFVDLGFKSAFFGASPELLYRREGFNLATESLAGTRARSQDKKLDERLKEELSLSTKDINEHALVSTYIEERLKLLGGSITAMPLEVRALSYVQHLLKRYCAEVTQVDDAQIIKLLHPTPAVCGKDTLWAKSYIREAEEFDRGLYAGPIGVLGQDEAEISVGIRSALYSFKNLYIYVASGIIKDSIPHEEWEELCFKEKTILSIFHG